MVHFFVKYTLIGVALAFLGQFIWMLDLNKRVYPHRPGTCQTVQGIEKGSEHLEYIPSENIVLISSGLQMMTDIPDRPGKIFLYDFSEKANKAYPLAIDRELHDFHPHGMSHFIENGKIYLYAVTHTMARNGFKHSIELFEFNKKGKSLHHIKSYQHEALFRPNGVFAVGMDKFFVTNDGRAQKGYMNLIEVMLNIPTGSVIYYENGKVHAIVSYDLTPNGLWVDLKNKILYYSSHLGEFVKAIKLNDDLKSQKEYLGKAALLSGVDNLFLDQEGYLWTAGNPVFHRVFDASKCFTRELRAGEFPPSQVLRIKFSDDFRTHEVIEPYTDDGEQITCSAGAIHNGKGQMLIGSVGTTLLHCTYTPESIKL
ncbi:unnamed protein product, partial [Mesorhabditis spiculigera]